MDLMPFQLHQLSRFHTGPLKPKPNRNGFGGFSDDNSGHSIIEKWPQSMGIYGYLPMKNTIFVEYHLVMTNSSPWKIHPC